MENNDINITIGRNLQKLRRNMKLTQLELAEKFNYSDKSISKWEKGESLPSIEVLYQLAKFYGVSLDALTTEGEIILPDQPALTRDRLFPTKLIIALLAISAVWITATIVYVTNQILTGNNLFMVFLWSVPISCVLLIIFNAIWGKRRWLFWILSFLLWSMLVCLHIQLIEYNVWIIYFVGIPLQIAVILWSALMSKPKIKHPKEKKEKPSKKEKKNKKASQTNEDITASEDAENKVNETEKF